MFKPLGLFTARCPDPHCKRPTCFFKHGEPSSSASPAPTPTESTASRPRLASQSSSNGQQVPSVKRKAGDDTAPSASPLGDSTRDARSVGHTPQPRANDVAGKDVKKPKIEPLGKGSPMSIVSSSKGSETNKVKAPMTGLKAPIPGNTAPVQRAVASSTAIPANLSLPPSLPRSTKMSPQPFADRQKALATLFQQYSKLYAPILSSCPDLAHKSAIAQEADTSASSANLRAYKSAIHHAAVNISRRPPPTSPNHPSVGTVKESRVATDAAEKAKASKPSRERVKGYCLPVEEFSTWGYPDPLNTDLVVGGGEEPSAEGTTQICSRCKVSFTVSLENLDERQDECKFHYGRTAPERIEGRRKWIYSCCGRERGEAGCQVGVHVFSDGDDDEKLKRRVGYRTVKQIVEGMKGPKGWVDVVAMDCEMIYTTAGSSLARVTIVDEDGHILLDELARPKVPVLDLNSRFSGINPGDLDKALMDLESVRAAACMFIGPDTIIVGHGLENDLRALRLIHDKVIDTAILFPHDKGRPYRRALRDIVKEKLGYFIQDRTSDLGHSSAEDAKATLECLKWKVRTDAE